VDTWAVGEEGGEKFDSANSSGHITLDEAVNSPSIFQKVSLNRLPSSSSDANAEDAGRFFTSSLRYAWHTRQQDLLTRWRVL
jgi:hypothetical protein